ncbi:MAG: exported protein of unknown function [Candidatus Saccharibacteria bacterium]|nr:exported protein of unknown function [Candidatus Saccharibacteria bacterium]MDB5180988.1 exported protein of unknown function [Candidatus Saccharibacteria bacterium]
MKTKTLFTRSKVVAASLTFGLLAVLVFPFTVEALTTTTTISSTIGSAINVFTTSGTVNLNSTPTGAGVQTTASDTVTVSTNNSAGYTLSLAETTGSSALVSGGNSIPAITGSTFASPTALSANTWGYRVDGIGGFGAGPTTGASNATIGTTTYAPVPATGAPQTLKTTGTTATNDVTTVWYSVAVNTATPSGTYTNSVTYTATTN